MSEKVDARELCIRCGTTTYAPQDGKNCSTCWAQLEAERDALRERLTCAEVICQQTQKIDDERQDLKRRLREATP